jgi:hypothetical protein
VLDVEVAERTTLVNDGANMTEGDCGVVLPVRCDEAQSRNQDLLHGPRTRTSASRDGSMAKEPHVSLHTRKRPLLSAEGTVTCYSGF